MRRTRFETWCKKDVKDERKIDYTFTTCEGEVQKFTSDEEFDNSFIQRIGQAWIKSLKLVDDVWHVELVEEDMDNSIYYGSPEDADAFGGGMYQEGESGYGKAQSRY